MLNSTTDEGDNAIPTSTDSMVYLNVNDLTVSSDGGSSGISSNRESPFPQEQIFDGFQQQPSHSVIIERNILFAKDFYPIAKNDTESLKTPETLLKLNCLSNSVKECLPCYKSTNDSSSKTYTFSCLSFLFNVFPILKWLTSYSIRKNLLYDVIAGVTILALHIPQGLAYGRLAGAEPINGLYVSLFPVVVYAIFGGSRQISIGKFKSD